jgi:Ser/Thr protein kinase RdoA (MazF antagonist)
MDLSEDLAFHALDLFPVQVAQIQPLRQSDNLTWKVEDRAGQPYLLRIHRSISATMAGTRQQPDKIRSELTWLHELGKRGLPLQRPIRSHSGEYVALLPTGVRPLPCTLLTWIEGSSYNPVLHAEPAVAANFGILTAFLHIQAETWTPPPDFVRPVYDVAHFHNLFASLSQGLQKNIIAHRDWNVIEQVLEKLIIDIQAAEALPGQWGLIHADLHSGNILIRGNNNVLPIDFSMCGTGSFLYDISIALIAGMAPELRWRYLRTYQRIRALPDEHLLVVDTYGLAGVLAYCAFQIENPDQMEWLTYRFPRLAAGECRKYLNGQPIYLDWRNDER